MTIICRYCNVECGNNTTHVTHLIESKGCYQDLVLDAAWADWKNLFKVKNTFERRRIVILSLEQIYERKTRNPAINYCVCLNPAEGVITRKCLYCGNPVRGVNS